MTLNRDDRKLAKRLLRGDQAAFDEYFGRAFPAAYRFALVRLGDETLAEEVAQDTLCRAMRKLHTYRGEAALMTWTLTLCRRRMSDMMAKLGRSLEVPFEDLDDVLRSALESICEPEGPEAHVERGELASFVRSALDRLSERHRFVLEAKYLRELSVRDIARELDTTEKATESLLTRARASFREAFVLLGATTPGTLEVRS